MDVFLGKVTQQAMNYAIRSGVTLTATYAIRQSAKLLKTSPKSTLTDELDVLRQRLQHKIRIVSPAIDMIELIAARGNTTLESALALTKDLRLDIQVLGQRLASAATASEEAYKSSRASSQAKAQNEAELKSIIVAIKDLLARIEDAIPLINLAITTSGASLSTSLPTTVSPSRLLQASTFLTAGDTQYSMTPNTAVQIGPTFTLTVYMLFAGHERPQNEEDIRETTWKEVMHKARVKLRRVPLDLVLKTGSGSDAVPSAQIKSPSHHPTSAEDTLPAATRSDEFAYQLMMVEDFDDDRVHDFESDQAQPGPFDDVALAGVREMIPIHEISKIFYADTSKVLNIGSEGESNHPVLLLKRDLNAVPPRRMSKRDPLADENEEDSVDEHHYQQQQYQQQQHYVGDDYAGHNLDPWRLPPSLDPEWIAFEVYTESSTSESDSDSEPDTKSASSPSAPPRSAPSPGLAASLSALSLRNTNSDGGSTRTNVDQAFTSSKSVLPTAAPPPWASAIRTSLSLLETLLRLTSLQQFQQQSHLSITDELLNFFLEESASTGAGGDEAYRQNVRAEARRRVGWDPYDESPVKRRGEQYQYQYQDQDQEYGDRTREGTPGSVGAWSPRSGEGGSPSPSPAARSSPFAAGQGQGQRTSVGGGRAEWLRRQSQGQAQERRGSPLRPGTAQTDEGIGTSPASSHNRGKG